METQVGSKRQSFLAGISGPCTASIVAMCESCNLLRNLCNTLRYKYAHLWRYHNVFTSIYLIKFI
jgi:hypothetical protein